MKALITAHVRKITEKKLVGNGNFTRTEITFCHEANIDKKQLKELGVFRIFMKNSGSSDVIQSITGSRHFPKEFQLISLSQPDDPPDIRLLLPSLPPVNIEITDFPPNSTPLSKELFLHGGPTFIPSLHTAGSNPKNIRKALSLGLGSTCPTFTPVGDEVKALIKCAQKH